MRWALLEVQIGSVGGGLYQDADLSVAVEATKEVKGGQGPDISKSKREWSLLSNERLVKNDHVNDNLLTRN